MAAVERKQQIIRIQNAQRAKAAKKEAHKRRVLGSRLLLLFPYLLLEVLNHAYARLVE